MSYTANPLSGLPALLLPSPNTHAQQTHLANGLVLLGVLIVAGQEEPTIATSSLA